MEHDYSTLGGGANSVQLYLNGAEIVLAPLPIGFAVSVVHLATIPITGTGINPASRFGAAIIYNNQKIWDQHVRIQIQNPTIGILKNS
ncbi:conserved hypothetical protein [Ricinus communis]|uniref:Uncharacterized protein n=1 Tax=Ricinus communis TaxID=3988 RepID=B9SYR9_RICCO|nr:conserved hypothetical protein [Ricinus communis]